MSRPDQVRSTKKIKVLIGVEGSFGVIQDNDLYQCNIISFDMPFNSTALEVGSDIAGKNTQMNAVSRKDNAMFNTTISMLFDHNAHNFLSNTFVFNNITEDTIYDDKTYTIHYTNAAQNTQTHKLRGAAITNVVFKEDAGSENGMTVVDITFMSGFPPNTGTSELTIRPQYNTHQSSIFDTKLFFTANNQLFPLSWEITINQPLERVGYRDNMNPLKYVQSGPYEITGTLNVKQDVGTNNVQSQLTGLDSDARIAMDIQNNDGTALLYRFYLRVCVDGATADVGGSFITNTIPFRAVGENPYEPTIHQVGAEAVAQIGSTTENGDVTNTMGGGY